MANALLQHWSGPYGGVPPFNVVTVPELKAALEQSMELYRRELQQIAEANTPATFANTIEALEKAGRSFKEVAAIFGTWSVAMNDAKFQEVERELAPVLAAFEDEITQNEPLFRRIAAVYESPDTAKLTKEQQRLAWLTYTNFVRAGAKLSPETKKKLAEVNQKLASLFTEFSQLILAEEDTFILLEREQDLEGLSDDLRAAAAAEAEARGHKGKWAIANTRSAVEPFLTSSTRRDLRERVFRAFVKRGENGDKNDTRKLITQILKARAERAKLLGYETHAHWRLEMSMAQTPERANELLTAMWKPAVDRVREEVRDMQALADKEGAGITIEPWDYRYYAEKVRKAKYDLDENELKPYLQMEKLREGMFFVAGELFGIEFTPVSDVPIYHPDVRVWRVTRKNGGAHVGLWYFDPYARPGKHSGAWMSAYREQARVDGEMPTLVSNNANFMKGRPGEPLLISWDDARTLFHEFGHALHGLLSNVTYPSLSGTNVFRDYVEFPSQLLENWLSTPEVLDRFARHHATGEPMPKALMKKLEKAAKFNQGFSTLEMLSSAVIDMRLHLAGDADIDVSEFERKTLAELGMPKELVMRHRTPHFSHVFSSDAYSAGYYSYLWADTIVADAYEAFMEGKGPYDGAIAEKLRRHVLEVGNTLDPAESYRAFRGRDAGIEPLMRKRGFL